MAWRLASSPHPRLVETDLIPPEILSWVAWVLSLTAQEVMLFLAGFVPAAVLTLTIGKYLLIYILRQFGLYSPGLYAALPRLPWRSLYRAYLIFARIKTNIFGSRLAGQGGFASSLWAKNCLYTPDQILLGRAPIFNYKTAQPVGLPIERHMFVSAMTGAGKSVWMKGMVALYQGSMFLTDPKNEIARDIAPLDTAREWITLHPYEPAISGQVNPFDCIKLALSKSQSDAIRWANYIGQSFIETPTDSKQPYFTDASRGFLVGLLLYVLAHHPKEEHNLGAVRALIVHGLRVYNEDGSLESTPEESRALLYKFMLESDAFDGAIAGAAAPFINASKETRGNLESTLQERTKVLDIPSIAHMLQRTTRPLSELKTCRDYVLSFAPSITSLKGELKDLARLLCNMVIFTFETTTGKNGQSLMVVDEFNAQGYNQAIETALPIARSMGLTCVVVAQDIEGVKASYPKTWKSFIGNADVALFMATNHPDNLRHISQSLGKTTLFDTHHQTGQQTPRQTEVMSAELTGRFLSPREGNLIAFYVGARALKLKLVRFYDELPVTRYLPDPDFKEPILKRFSRLMLWPLIRWKKHRVQRRAQRRISQDQGEKA